MPLWQKTMTGLARNKRLTRFLHSRRSARSLATRFMGGESVEAAIRRAVDLRAEGIAASLYFLGEYVESPEAIEENVAQILAVSERLGLSELDLHVSLDPTQIGYAHSHALGEANGMRIGQLVARQPSRGSRRLLMLDMENFSVVQTTLDLRASLAQTGCPTGITIQAYLHRSRQDVSGLIEAGAAAIRLVKGAFAENADRAWTTRTEVGREYLQLACDLLAPNAKARGVYPIFATHDDAMIQAIIALAERNHRTTNEYEFEMLLGARPELQRRIVAEGHQLRLYLPFGTEWWPYTLRRIGENPANFRFVLNALCKK
jgi:proline dehydrogenase